MNNKDISSYLDDEQLLLLYKLTRDLHYWAALFMPHYKTIYDFACSHFKSPDMAMDIVHDLYLQLPKTMSSQEIKNFRQWLYVSMLKHCKHSNRQGDDAEYVLVHVPEVVEEKKPLREMYESYGHKPKRDFQKRLERTFDKLESGLEWLKNYQREKYRAILRWYFIDQRNLVEIAQLSGWTFVSVQSLVQQAMLLLRKEG